MVKYERLILRIATISFMAGSLACSKSVPVPIFGDQVPTLEPLQYKVFRTSDDLTTERYLNAAAAEGFRLQAVHKRTQDPLNLTMMTVARRYSPSRFQYRVLSASWPPIKTATEDEGADVIAETISEEFSSSINAAATEGFYDPGHTIHFLTEEGSYTGARLILEKDNREEAQVPRPAWGGPLKALITRRASTMENELNQAAKQGYRLQSILTINPGTMDSLFMAATGLFLGLKVVAVLAHDESSRAEYRVFRHQLSRDKTIASLNDLFAQGFRYRTHVAVNVDDFMIFMERNAGDSGEDSLTDHFVMPIYGIEDVPLLQSTVEGALVKASRYGYTVLGVAESLIAGGIAILSRPKSSSHLP